MSAIVLRPFPICLAIDQEKDSGAMAFMHFYALSKIIFCPVLSPSLYIAYIIRGSLRSDADVKESLKDINKAISVKPDAASAYIIRGLIEYDQGKKKEAEADFQKASQYTNEDLSFFTLFIRRLSLSEDFPLPCESH
jgi:tetratricopeptide (TPR) repeat protein